MLISKRASSAELEVERLLLDIIKTSPFAGKVYSVGGFVRDEMLGKQSKDLDLVVEMKNGAELLANWIHDNFPDQTSRPHQLGAGYPIWHIAFKEDVIHDGKEYKTAGGEIDIADTQKESFPDPTTRQRVTEFGTISDDVQRRDFTVNMLLKDLSKDEIVDLTGVSKNDLQKGILRGHPEVSLDKMFSDDPLRMMRLIRFQVKYGWDVPLSVIKAIKKNKDKIEIISWERIQDELKKMMALGKTAEAIRLMKACGLLEKILPEIYGLIGVKQDKRHHEEGDVYKHTLKVLSNAKPTIEHQLAALLHDIGKPQTQEILQDKISFFGHAEVGAEIAEAMLKRLRFDNKVVEKMKTLVRNHMRPHLLGAEASEKALRALIRDVGQELIMELTDLAEADTLGSLPVKNYVPKLREKINKSFETPILKKPILNGNEIAETLNVKPGKIIGEATKFLLELEDEYVENKQEFTKEVAKQELLKWKLSRSTV